MLRNRCSGSTRDPNGVHQGPGRGGEVLLDPVELLVELLADRLDPFVEGPDQLGQLGT